MKRYRTASTSYGPAHTVNDGAQAIVGNVAAGRGRVGHEKKGQQQLGAVANGGDGSTEPQISSLRTGKS
jgi:hypothetical protein